MFYIPGRKKGPKDSDTDQETEVQETHTETKNGGPRGGGPITPTLTRIQRSNRPRRKPRNGGPIDPTGTKINFDILNCLYLTCPGFDYKSTLHQDRLRDGGIKDPDGNKETEVQ